MLKFLKEQLTKLQEYYQHSSSSSVITEEQKIALKQWQYCTQLTKYMYQVGRSFLIDFYQETEY